MLFRLTCEIDMDNKSMVKLFRKFLTHINVLHTKPSHEELVKKMPGIKFGSKLRLVPKPQQTKASTIIVPPIIGPPAKPVKPIILPIERSMPLPEFMEQVS